MLDAYHLLSVETHKSVGIQRLVPRRGEIFVAVKQGKFMFDNSARIIMPNKQIPKVFTETIVSQARRQIQSFKGWLYFFSWLQLFFETGGNLFKVRARRPLDLISEFVL